MKPHYFIGIKIPQNIAEHLTAERDAWNLQSHKRQTPAQDMHITLLFIGEDVHDEIGQVEQLLAQIKQQPFMLNIDGIKTFGNSATPRIIYASLENSGELIELQQQVNKALESLKIRPDLKEFVPHITLASKWAGGKPAAPQFSISEIQFEVTDFSLFRIVPKEMSRYQKIANYPL
ncbi:ABC transporter permease [Planococcus antarcticus DSM 14505]|uniref:RNA 2',3'-cyclic phosphodiesterase n=1 Tax=Planococcus antarcticus DSM 14505 TaxID=1185653 RepID=A0A1C7DJR4_9BACL|nr:RNA 2',3'-cyclic phosphodiesterase [Planococcus antarcticus]ANU11453.1 2'-5' RNA ligase [Planococcus antarcticus DSM 14505]EIM06597.1 ABC transporter permease [Planococcus antarcticus DSM 14505]